MRRLVFAVLLATACHSKDEARALVTAVDAYRSANNDDKPARADALDKVACTDEEVCAAKKACRKSADATARGLRLQAEIQAAIQDGGKPDPDAMQKKFDQANSDLAEGYGYLEECRTKIEALHQRFGI
jgi:hypothetical protein